VFTHVRHAWAAALRSDKFKQVRDAECRRLDDSGRHVSPRYCAFGLLVHLAERELRVPLTCQVNPSDEAMVSKDCIARFEEWAGAPGFREAGPDHDLIAQVVEANDAGKTFEEIAGLVEG